MKATLYGYQQEMFLAGTDTASATLVWTMTELIRNPEGVRQFFFIYIIFK
jgi:cytochrome P450